MHYYSIFQVPRATTFPVLCKPRKFWVLLSISFITNRNSRNNAPPYGNKAASSVFFWELLVYEKSHMFKKSEGRIPRDVSKNWQQSSPWLYYHSRVGHDLTDGFKARLHFTVPRGRKDGDPGTLAKWLHICCITSAYTIWGISHWIFKSSWYKHSSKKFL